MLMEQPRLIRTPQYADAHMRYLQKNVMPATPWQLIGSSFDTVLSGRPLAVTA